MTAEQNYKLLLEIEANRSFILIAYRQNPRLMAQAEARIRQLFDEPEAEKSAPKATAQTTKPLDRTPAATSPEPTSR